MIDEPIVGTLLGFAFFAGLVYIFAEAMRFDHRAFTQWFRWRMNRPQIKNYEYAGQFVEEYLRWKYHDRPIRPVFKQRKSF